MEKHKLTQQKLKKTHRYNPYTGIFTKRTNRNKCGHYDGNGYICVYVGGEKYRANRLAWLYMEGYWPENDIDHKDRVKDNNRWKNLRHVSRQCNNRNKGLQNNNNSKVAGVGWYDRLKKWQARITVNRKLIYIGVYETKLEAVKRRWRAEKKYGFPNCNSTSSAYLYLMKAS